MKDFTHLFMISFFLCWFTALCLSDDPPDNLKPTTDDGSWFYLAPQNLTQGRYHARHAEIFGKYVTGYNHYVLRGVDKTQETAPQGGGYFIGVKAVPAESPLGYPLKLFGLPILAPPRKTSYCSGASYGALIEALNMIFPGGEKKLNLERFEAMRMQEPDGGRREDGVKFWGHWNADGYGSHYALVQYGGMGEEVSPQRARPGDFMNLTWKKGGGHSVVFLGYIKDEKTRKTNIAYWSSQAESNGFADVYTTATDKVRHLKTVRLTKPENLFNFDPEQRVVKNVPRDVISP